MKRIGFLLTIFGLFCSFYGQSQIFPKNQFTNITANLQPVKSNNPILDTDYYQLMKYGSEKNSSSLEKSFFRNHYSLSSSELSIPFLSIFSPGINYDPYYYCKTSGFDTNKFSNIILMRAVASIHLQMKIK